MAASPATETPAERVAHVAEEKVDVDERAQNIMMLLGEMQFQQEKYRDALLDWQQLVAKYPDTNSSSQAQFRIASTWQEHLGDPEKALEEYRKLTWGDWQGQAQQAIKRLNHETMKRLND